MRPGVQRAPEVELGILVLDGVLVVALVEGAVAVHYYDLRPVGEAGVGGIGLEDPCVGAIVGLRPDLGSAEHALASPVAGVEGGGQISAHACAASDEVKEDIPGVPALVEVDHRTAAVEALGLGISPMDYFTVVAVRCKADNQQQQCNKRCL